MKYIAVLVRKTGEQKTTPNFDWIQTKEFKPKDKTIDFKGKSYIVYLDSYTENTGKKKYYYYDEETGDLLNIKTNFSIEKRMKISPEDINHFTGRKTIEMIVTGVKQTVGSNWVIIILGIGCGIGLGLVIGHFLFPNNIYIPATPPVTPSV